MIADASRARLKMGLPGAYRSPPRRRGRGCRWTTTPLEGCSGRRRQGAVFGDN